MEEREIFTLTKSEFQMMETLWNAGRSLSKSEIIENSPNRTWKASSVYIILRSLLKKGAIAEDGVFYSNTNIGRKFKPTLSQKDYAIMQIDKARMENKISLSELMAGLVKHKVSDKKVDELKNIIDNNLD